MNLENIIKEASIKLKNNNIISHVLDAEIILADIMGLKRESLIINDKINISEDILKKYNIAIKRRINNEPIAYITGKKEFWSQDFFTNRATLVPRPETELLIYKLVDIFKNKKINILDVGTGTGCILLSLLKELYNSRGTGIDISSEAIRIARVNSKNLNLVNRAKFKNFEIDKYALGRYDLIVSNPPYIPSKDIKKLSKDIINFEPKEALDGGSDGLDLIKKVIYKSNILLKRNGIIALEIGFGQYRKVSQILKYCKFKEHTKIFDYNGNVRCIIGTKTDFFKIKK